LCQPLQLSLASSILHPNANTLLTMILVLIVIILCVYFPAFRGFVLYGDRRHYYANLDSAEVMTAPAKSEQHSNADLTAQAGE
jgi:threonine/homoserine/homoserine lactone efflux protein